MVESGKGTTRIISAQVSEEVLKADLEKYRGRAMQLGAARAEVIPAKWVQVDERVRLKCNIPPCPHYGRCANCPPHTPELDFMRKAFGRFGWAVLFKNDVIPVEDFTDLTRYFPDGQKHQKMTMEIAGEIESLAFADGYYFALGFGSGSCQDGFCKGMLCQMLDSGRCSFQLRARPSMEAVGIDVFELVTKVGWEVYPIYRSVDSKLVPCAISVGIVFIH